MSWASLCRALGLFAVGLFLISAFTPLPNVLARWLSAPPRLERAEAIVVLGGGVQPDGALSISSLRRALHGMALHWKGLAPLLVLSGAPREGGSGEAVLRADLARQCGISPQAILTGSNAQTTREEAVHVGAVLRPRGIRRILLVTNALHMARARGLFERVGFEVLAAPSDDFSGAVDKPEERLGLTRRIFQESVARVYYRVAGYL